MPGVKSRPAAPAPPFHHPPLPRKQTPAALPQNFPSRNSSPVAEQGKVAFTEIGSQTFFAGQKSSVFVNMQLYQFAAFTT